MSGWEVVADTPGSSSTCTWRHFRRATQDEAETLLSEILRFLADSPSAVERNWAWSVREVAE